MTTNTPSEQPAIPEGAGAEEMRELIAGILWADDPANHQSGMTLDSDEVALLAKHFCGPIEQPAQASEVGRLRKLLGDLEASATAVYRKGAQTGPQWSRMSGDLIRARAALNPSQERAEADHG